MAKSKSKLESLWFPDSQTRRFFEPEPGQCGRRGLFLASSRLSRKLDQYPQLFAALRTIATKLESKKHFLITAGSTTCDSFVCRIGELFNIPVVKLQPLPNNPSKFWFESCAAMSRKQPDQHVAFYPSDKIEKSVDELAMELADEVIGLSVRKGGNIERLMVRRLNAGVAPATTKIFVDSSLTKRKTQDQLVSQGVVAWHLVDGNACEQSKKISDLDAQRPSQPPRILQLNELKLDNYLIHWTRRCTGPWPDQTYRQFLDDLIFGTEAQDHREVASLFRILATRRLIATNDLTRDPRPVVCFSGVPLDQLQSRRVFRKHLGRWDFEPYGVAIEKSHLEQLGARPAIYGDDSTWKSLDDDDRPFFQSSAPSSIDWSEEKEWRVTGDIELTRIPTLSAVAFVPNLDAACAIESVCPWPIVVLEEFEVGGRNSN